MKKPADLSGRAGFGAESSVLLLQSLQFQQKAGNMTHFIVTFSIKSDSDYHSRYSSFTKRVGEIATDGTWEETTSFYALRAAGTASSVCTDLYVNSEFDATKDKMVVIDLDKREKATKGEISYPNSLEAALGF
jgi:hypothetical protein